MIVHMSFMLGSCLVMVMLSFCSPSRICMTLATAYFIVVDTVTLSVHVELSRCVDRKLLPYMIISGVISTFFVLALIISFMYLTKNYSALFLDKTDSFKDQRTFVEDLN